MRLSILNFIWEQPVNVLKFSTKNRQAVSSQDDTLLKTVIFKNLVAD